MHIIQDHRPNRGRFETTSSSSNLESINLEDEDISYVPNVLERPPNKKAEKKYIFEETKSKESTVSNMEDLLNVMMEKRKKNWVRWKWPLLRKNVL